MSRRFVELYGQSVVCTLLDEFFGVTKASSGKRDGDGLRQHIEPMGVKLRLIAEQVSFPDSFEDRVSASLGDRPSRSSIALVIPVIRSLAGFQAFAYLVHFEGGLIRQASEFTEPSSRSIAQPISVGKLALPKPDAVEKAHNAVRPYLRAETQIPQPIHVTAMFGTVKPTLPWTPPSAEQ